MPLCTSVYMCLVVTCWERADLLALVCGVLLLVCHFPIGILGQVWYLIVSIPDLCTLTYFYSCFNHGLEILLGYNPQISFITCFTSSSKLFFQALLLSK